MKKDYTELRKPMENDPSWLTIALKEYGQKEIQGKKKNNPRINNYLKSTTFNKSQINDEVAWCSAFANWCIKEAGLAGTNSAAARSWEKWGKKIIKPTRGCIAVFERGEVGSWQGHVGFYMSETNDFIEVLGGNQGNEVKISKYGKDRLLGFRRLETTLKEGSKGGAVAKLQKFLQKLKENIGKDGADGDFGNKTKKAVKKYQKKMGFKQTGKVEVEFKGKKVVFIFGKKDDSKTIKKKETGVNKKREGNSKTKKTEIKGSASTNKKPTKTTVKEDKGIKGIKGSSNSNSSKSSKSSKKIKGIKGS